jgi:multisubunit Na+/H+ antiporter MnhE subunit
MFNLVQSNLIIAYDILTPKMRIKPDIIYVSITIKSDFGLLLFSNLVSMTPGSLSIDMNKEKTILEIHVLYNKNKEKVLQDIENIQSKINYLIS